jgi:copper transport protein
MGRKVKIASPGIILALLCALALLAPAGASAHARLEATSPAQGAVVKEEPGAVVFTFDEPVEGNFGAVRVYDPAGERVDEGDAFHPGGEGPRLGVHLKPGLPDGSYTATYRVVSADGHIVSSGYVFSIGKSGKAPSQTVGELIGGSGSGTVTETAYGLARGLSYAAIALAVGALVFLLLCWLPAARDIDVDGTKTADMKGKSSRQPGEPVRAAGEDASRDAFYRRLRAALWIAAGVGALAAAAQIVLEGAEAAGVPGFSALTETIIKETLETHFGTIWGFAFIAWIVFAALVPFVGRRGGRLLALVPLAYLVLCPALGGHASTQSPVGVNFPVNVVHVGAMAIWLGGLATLLFVLPAATRAAASPADRARLLAGPLARFSSIALAMVALIMATGLIQAYVYVRHLGDLLNTGYGRAVLAKFLLLLAVMAVAAYNRQRSVPRLEAIAARGEAPGGAGVMLRRALRGEVALLLVVLGVAAALASYAPPVSAESGPFSISTTSGPTTLELDVDPARVGANQIHIYYFDAKTGAQYSRAKELKVTATLPSKHIGPLPLSVQDAGPGHYIVPDALLNAPGEWKLDLTLRVSAFDQFEKTIEVPVG